MLSFSTKPQKDKRPFYPSMASNVNNLTKTLKVNGIQNPVRSLGVCLSTLGVQLAMHVSGWNQYYVARNWGTFGVRPKFPLFNLLVLIC